MLEQVEWGEFKLWDLFEKLNLKFLKWNFSKWDDISKEKTAEFDLPLVNAKDGNNWIMYYWRSCDFESAEMTIDIVNDWAVSTWNVYPQIKKTWVLYNAYLIKPSFDVNDKILYFLSTTIQKSIKLKYWYQNKASWEKVKKEKINLPIKNWKIDFEFINKFIAELEAESQAELEAYLGITWLKNYELTSDELKLLKEFEEWKIEWKEFHIWWENWLFVINSYKKRFDANKVDILEFWYPYVVRTANNNWLRGYLNEDEQYLNDWNTISFGQDTATMFYQEKPYFTWDKIKIVKSKSNKFNASNAHFFITSMSKAFSSFARGQSSFNVRTIENQNIRLPIDNDNNPDYELMKSFISAVQKLVIKDVVIYNQERIKATAEVINK